MAGAARANKVHVTTMPMKEEDNPSTMHVNLKKHPIEADMGETVRFSGTGKVMGINKDEFGHTMRLEVTNVSCGESEEEEGGESDGKETDKD